MRLHVGCGTIRLPGWINVDVRPSPATDVVDDVSALTSFQDNSIDMIYACHVLEHFGFANVRPTAESVVRRWVQLLKPGGQLPISVPDLRQISSAWNAHPNNLTAQMDFLRALYGGSEYPENRHFIGFTAELLANLLTSAGLSGIGRFEPFSNDTSKFVLHGIPISINMGGVKQVADLSMVTAYVNTVEPGRFRDAQMGFIQGCTKFNVVPLFFVDGSPKPKLGELLKLAREKACSGWMLWCNSDCRLIADPRKYLTDPQSCHGFHRREDPSGAICEGVDFYAIPVSLWDEVLSKDIPDLYVGVSHVDWWLTRACQKLQRYVAVKEGVILHPSHPRSPASADYNDPLHKHNVEAYNAWARRNAVEIDANG